MQEREIPDYLQKNKFFAGMAPEYVDILARGARVRQLAEDEVIFRYDQPAEHFYLICTGRVTVEIPAIQGPPLELQSLGPGAVSGWSWLVAPQRSSFQVRACEPTEIIEFDGRAILARCEEDPRFGYELLKRFSTLMSERLNFARQKMMEEWSPPGFA